MNKARQSLLVFLMIFHCSCNSQGTKKEKTKPDYLYKITSVSQWESSKGKDVLELTPADSDFIHLATKEQVFEVVKKFFADQDEYVLLKLDTDKLPGDLVYEKNPGGKIKYYHLYNGEIPMDAVVEHKRVKQENLL